MSRLRVFLSAGLSTAEHRSRNLELTRALEEIVDVYLPQRDGGLFVEMVSSGMPWREAAQLVKRRDIAALQASDLVIAVLTEPLVGAGVAFELGVADAVGMPCWSLVLDATRAYKSPIIESAVSRELGSLDELLRAVRDYAAAVNGR